MPGTATSRVEVTNILKLGFWRLADRELLPHSTVPWLECVTVNPVRQLEGR
jgi:hypothetical protein